MPPGTKFFNADNGLRRFFGLVPAVPYKLKRAPEADQAKTHAQTARRSAGLGLAGMAGGAGCPRTGPFRTLGGTGNSRPVVLLVATPGSR